MDRLVWAGTSTFRVGDLHLGVRSNTLEMHELLRRALAPHLVEGVDAPANFSVQVGGGTGDHGAAGKAFHFLYADATTVVRTRDPRRLVHALLAHLSGHAPREDAEHLRVHGRAYVKDGEAVLLPGAVNPWLPVVERRLNVRGIRLVDVPWLALRPAGARVALVVPEPSIQVDRSVLDELGPVSANGRGDTRVACGTYPVRSWALLTAEGQLGPLPRAQAVLWATMLVLNGEDHGAQWMLEGLADVMRSVQPVGITWTDERELMAALLALS